MKQQNNYMYLIRNLKSTIMTKSLVTNLHLWGFFFQFTHAQPLPCPTDNVGHEYPGFVPSFNNVEGGERENWEQLSKRMRCFLRVPRNYKKIVNTALMPWTVQCRCIILQPDQTAQSDKFQI